MGNDIQQKNSSFRDRFVKILLTVLLLYLGIEVARYYIVYSTVVSASRTAVRYGSTTGISSNGVQRYQDCQGIKDAAQSMNNRSTFSASDITITYDHGSGTSVYDTCDGFIDTNVDPVDGDRVVVVITTDFHPIIPIFEPFLSRTIANGNPIVSKSTRTIITSVAIEVTPAATLDISIPTVSDNPFEVVDNMLKQSVGASLAYNVPAEMDVGETATVELLLNPSLSEQELVEEVSESGVVYSGTVEITPQMKAEIKLPTQDAFQVTPLHDDAIQFVSSLETTKWSWYVTAQEAGTQRLTIVVYRLVKVDSDESWREVETYKSDINVKVTFGNQIKSLDWKWIIGIIVTALLIPGFWRWVDARKKKKEAENGVNKKSKPRKKKS